MVPILNLKVKSLHTLFGIGQERFILNICQLLVNAFGCDEIFNQVRVKFYYKICESTRHCFQATESDS